MRRESHRRQRRQTEAEGAVNQAHVGSAVKVDSPCQLLRTTDKDPWVLQLKMLEDPGERRFQEGFLVRFVDLSWC